MATILVADDEAKMRKILGLALMEDDHEILEAKDADEAIRILHSTSLSLIISDLRMPGGGGLAVLDAVRKHNPTLPVLILTAYGTINNAVEALKCGAYDYLLKPCDLEELKLAVRKALQAHQLEQENLYLRKEISGRFGGGELIGKSAAMQKVFEMIRRAAQKSSPVLIRGESGTGKELAARAIHNQSARSHGPFVVVNCASLPADLLDLELFGRVKGPMTVSSSPLAGKIELASGGTIFLEEIGDLSPRLQNKMIRTLEDGTIEPIGDANRKKVDVRIIAASRQNLEFKIESGALRPEFYYKINVVPVTLPPLRERKEDISLFIDHFFKIKSPGRNHKNFTTDQIRVFQEYSWPGNVRELENVIERALVLDTTDTGLLLPALEENAAANLFSNDGYKDLLQMPHKDAKKMLLDQFESLYFTHLLHQTGGNVTRTAEISQMHRKNLHVKLAELGIDPRKFTGNGEAED